MVESFFLISCASAGPETVGSQIFFGDRVSQEDCAYDAARKSSLAKKLYVGNIPFTTTEPELREIFEKHGTLTSVNVITDRETGRSRGFAFVEFEDGASADAAQQALDGQDMGGRTLRVNEADERGGGGGGGGARRGGYGNRDRY